MDYHIPVEKQPHNGFIAHEELGKPLPATPADPWEAMIGRFADDPYWDEFQEELRRIREEANRIEVYE